MLRRGFIATVLGAIATVVGLTLPADVSAFYGDPRFFETQPPQLNHLLHNVTPDEYLVTTAGGNSTRLMQVGRAVADWNNALRAAPNSLTKYPLHFNFVDDPNANVVIYFAPQSTVTQNCRKPGDQYDPPACNDGQVPITHIWISDALGTATQRYIEHELGHSLWYTDQYNAGTGTCHTNINGAADPDSVMNNCGAMVTARDYNDFQTRYEPTYQSADATYVDTGGSHWNAVYQTGDVTIKFPSSLVEYLYYWQQLADTGGTQIASGYTATNANSNLFNFNLQTRFCTDSKIYNEVGYPGTRSWSPRSQYSCVGAAQVQNAGFLLSTSDRTNPSTSTLYLRIKNFTGGTRNVGIFGYPNFNDIGCGYQNLPYLDTRPCAVTLSRGAYNQLAWYAWDGSLLSWGYLDFE